MAGDLEATGLQTLGTIHDNAIEEEIRELLGCEYTCHRVNPSLMRALWLRVTPRAHYTLAKRLETQNSLELAKGQVRSYGQGLS